MRDLLRLGLAQAFWLDTPAFAAVDTTVALAPVGLRGLVNAVLRGAVARRRARRRRRKHLAPAWLLARWRAAFGEAEADAIAAQIADGAAPPTSRPASRLDAAALSALEAEIPARRLDCAPPCAATPPAGPASPRGAGGCRTPPPPCRRGCSESRPGETVLDLCAAPGGKTLQLAAGGASVTAVDRAASRLARLAEGLRAHRSDGRDRRRRRRRPGPTRGRSTQCSAGRPLLRHRHLSPQSRRALERPARRDSASLPRSRRGCLSPPPTGSGRADGWSTASARWSPRKGEAQVRALSGGQARLRRRPHLARRGRRARESPRARGLASHPAPSCPGRSGRLLHRPPVPPPYRRGVIEAPP